MAACGKRCAGCGQVILGEGLKFGEERCGNIITLQQYNITTLHYKMSAIISPPCCSYHRACFRCSRAECGAALDGGKAHSVRGRPVCGDCYDKEFMER